jgi:nucleoside-diphosphate-sugar epimerase
MLKLACIFDKTVHESYEMLYQSEFDYYFDSTKFNNFISFRPKSYPDGIHETIEFFKKNKF